MGSDKNSYNSFIMKPPINKNVINGEVKHLRHPFRNHESLGYNKPRWQSSIPCIRHTEFALQLLRPVKVITTNKQIGMQISQQNICEQCYIN